MKLGRGKLEEIIGILSAQPTMTRIASSSRLTQPPIDPLLGDEKKKLKGVAQDMSPKKVGVLEDCISPMGPAIQMTKWIALRPRSSAFRHLLEHTTRSRVS